MKTDKMKVHFTDNDLIALTNPFEVTLIGSGGTSSKVLSAFEKDSLDRFPEHVQAGIYISCVDSVKARFEIAEILKGWIITGRTVTKPNTGWTSAITNPQDKSYCPLSETSGNRSLRNIRRLPTCHSLRMNMANY